MPNEIELAVSNGWMGKLGNKSGGSFFQLAISLVNSVTDSFGPSIPSVWAIAANTYIIDHSISSVGQVIAPFSRFLGPTPLLTDPLRTWKQGREKKSMARLEKKSIAE